MAEWLVESGIGEDRAIRLEGGAIAAARLHWPGPLSAGEVDDALLVERIAGSNSGVVRFPAGEVAHGRNIPRAISEGQKVRMEVTRSAIAERGRLKRATAKASDRPLCPAPPLVETLRALGEVATLVHRFPEEAGWEELWIEAWEGRVEFAGGQLLVDSGPAMTLIDVDGGSPEAAAPAIARTLSRMDIGGNIGVDFPTINDRGARRAVDAELGRCLAGWPHERTAMNGFGFVQLVARLERPSLLQRIARDRSGAAARLLLRRAERLEGAGAIELAAHPAVLARISQDWLAELRRRSGRQVTVRSDPGLALEAPHAQLVLS